MTGVSRTISRFFLVAAVLVRAVAARAEGDTSLLSAPPPVYHVEPGRAIYGRALLGRGVEADLAALTQIALERNLPLLSGRLDARTSEAAIVSARSAFDPTFAISSNYARRERLTIGSPPPSDVRTWTLPEASLSGTLPTSTEYSVGLTSTRTASRGAAATFPVSWTQAPTFSLTQPLLRDAGTAIANAPIEIAVLSDVSERESLARLAEKTIATVENLYHALAEAEESERAAFDSLERSEEVLHRNRELLARDLIPLMDLRTAEHGAATRSASFVETSRRRQDAAENLVFFVFGETARDRLEGETVLPRTRPVAVLPPVIENVESILALAIERRREIRAAQRDFEKSEIELRLSRNDLLPSLNLTGSLTPGGTADHYRFDYDRRGEVDDKTWSAGVTFSIPLGNRAARAARDQAEYDREKRRIALATAENVVRAEVRAAIRGVRAQEARLRLALEAEKLTREQYDLARKGVDLGLIDTFRLLQHEEDLSQAQTNAISARLALQNAITSYQLALGDSFTSRYPNALGDDGPR